MPTVREQLAQAAACLATGQLDQARQECRQVLAQRPTFIVGNPRSGTSLVEQILSAHRNVYGGGEMQAISQLIRGLPGALNTQDRYPGCVLSLTQQVADDAAQRYLDVLDESGGKSLRSTDKLPLNFFHLGLIAILFSEARVIECPCDPIDTCLSN